MNKHRTRTLRRLLRVEPYRGQIITMDGETEVHRTRPCWSVSPPGQVLEDPFVGDTRNEALRAAFMAREEKR